MKFWKNFARGRTKMYRAFLEQEARDPNRWITYAYCYEGPERLRATRFKNRQKYAQHIDLDTAVKVVISKTADTGNYVISITDVDGKTSSLWLDGGSEHTHLHVGNITSY